MQQGGSDKFEDIGKLQLKKNFEIFITNTVFSISNFNRITYHILYHVSACEICRMDGEGTNK